MRRMQAIEVMNIAESRGFQYQLTWYGAINAIYTVDFQANRAAELVCKAFNERQDSPVSFLIIEGSRLR